MTHSHHSSCLAKQWPRFSAQRSLARLASPPNLFFSIHRTPPQFPLFLLTNSLQIMSNSYFGPMGEHSVNIRSFSHPTNNSTRSFFLTNTPTSQQSHNSSDSSHPSSMERDLHHDAYAHGPRLILSNILVSCHCTNPSSL